MTAPTPPAVTPGRPSRLLITGPPGAGKGTQAVFLAQRLDVPAISTGDMFRALLSSDTPLAMRVRDIMSRGAYVDDDTTNAIVDDRLRGGDCRAGFLLDGYPRTLSQVKHLDDVLQQQGSRLDAVVCLDVPEDELVTRLLARGRDQGRQDDQADTVRARLGVYRDQTAPVIGHYRARGLLVELQASGSVEQVTDRLVSALSELSSTTASPAAAGSMAAPMGRMPSAGDTTTPTPSTRSFDDV